MRKSGERLFTFKAITEGQLSSFILAKEPRVFGLRLSCLAHRSPTAGAVGGVCRPGDTGIVM